MQCGQILVVIGPNGCGKSTLLRALAGHLPAAEGRIYILGQDVTKRTPYDRQVATVFQDAGLLGAATVERNLQIALKTANRRGSGNADALDGLFAAFGVERTRTYRSSILSGGERQLIGFIRALASMPTLLLVDEPTASLDASRARLLAAILRETVTQRAIPCVVVSHDMDFVLQIADLILMLDSHGKPLVAGRPQEFLDGGSSFSVAKLLGIGNVFGISISSETADCLCLDNWVEVQVPGVRRPLNSIGVRIAPQGIKVVERRDAPHEQERKTGGINGIIRSRRQTELYEHIMFEPDNIVGPERAWGRARGFMLQPGSTRDFRSMRTRLVFDSTYFSWLS